MSVSGGTGWTSTAAEGPLGAGVRPPSRRGPRRGESRAGRFCADGAGEPGCWGDFLVGQCPSPRRPRRPVPALPRGNAVWSGDRAAERADCFADPAMPPLCRGVDEGWLDTPLLFFVLPSSSDRTYPTTHSQPGPERHRRGLRAPPDEDSLVTAQVAARRLCTLNDKPLRPC